jgi:lipoprotein-releasing system ATP-binding protein
MAAKPTLNKLFIFVRKSKIGIININFISVNKGEFVSLIGKSGSGKSTLRYLLSTLDTVYNGNIIISDSRVTGKTQNELAIFRNQNIGFVFQFHFLLPEFTVLENVMIPAHKLGQIQP